jgi:Cytochrome P460
MRHLWKIWALAPFPLAVACVAIPSADDGNDSSANFVSGPRGLPLPTVQNACPEAQEDSLPLPTSIAPENFVDYEKSILSFLQHGEYKTLQWCMDKGVRDTGAYLKHVYYGTHPAVRIFYSPKVMQWLRSGRQGNIPDGATIIKEQYSPPAARYAAMSGDQLPQVSDWTIMIRDSKGSKDGWFWGEFFDGMKFDDDQPPFQYPWAGFGLYCLRCHAAAEKELTFSALRNIKGFPGKPISFPDDGSWRTSTAASPVHGNILPLVALKPGRQANPDFLQTFKSIPGVPFSSVQKMPSETYDNIPQPATGSGQFISSSQCMSCHGGLNGPFGPTMFLPSPLPAADKAAGANVSPYGEWRWSPMGLAGRDPIFFSQLESEFAYFDTLPSPRREELTTMVRNACLTCHGAMGKRQLDTDNGGKGDFHLSYLQIVDRSNPHFKYGSLARDGISCEVCHRNAPDQTPPGENALQHFLKNSITGHFQVSKPDRLYGPFKDDEIAPYAMQTGTGIKPEFNSYVKSSRMCGSCHTIDLPVVDGSPGEMKIEQATYLEWLNSQYQNELGTSGSKAKSCSDCHMPGNYHSRKKGIDVSQIQQRIAIIEDETYPETDHRISTDKITVRVRKEGFRRHEFLGLNVFLLEMVDQFYDVLGVRKDDYMSGSTTDLQDAIDNFVQQAQNDTAKVTTSSVVTGPQQLEAKVSITNQTGHRFPSGVSFRRLFIELLVTDDKQNIVWGSGRTNALGVIVDGSGKPLPSEFFAEYRDSQGQIRQSYQPHYEIITAQDQVQIYEELSQDADGKFTTNFTRRDVQLKDNRLLPVGWTRKGPDASLDGRYLHATYPEGNAVNDPDYQDGKAGTDNLAYKIQLPAGVDAAKCRVQATLYYQTIPPYYLYQRFTAAPGGDATKRLYYLTSNLNLTGTPVKNWKLPIVSTGFTTPGRAMPGVDNR